MKVKIGSEWIDSDDQPLAVQFTDSELDFIKNNMDKERSPNNRFAAGLWEDANDALPWLRECD